MHETSDAEYIRFEIGKHLPSGAIWHAIRQIEKMDCNLLIGTGAAIIAIMKEDNANGDQGAVLLGECALAGFQAICKHLSDPSQPIFEPPKNSRK